jgi:hypothetical protein
VRLIHSFSRRKRLLRESQHGIMVSRMLTALPFAPIRSSLYSPSDLMSGLDRSNYKTFGQTTDFKCYEYFVAHGRAAPRDALASIMEALHDNSITQATLDLLSKKQRVAAIVGWT